MGQAKEIAGRARVRQSLQGQRRHHPGILLVGAVGEHRDERRHGRTGADTPHHVGDGQALIVCGIRSSQFRHQRTAGAIAPEPGQRNGCPRSPLGVREVCAQHVHDI